MTKTISALTRNSALVGTLAAALMLAAVLPSAAHAALLTQQLDLGESNSDVTSLQTFLAQTPAIYPQGLVTGYFGSLTSAAVSRFQAANGLDAVGRVGPLTVALINSRMGGGVVITDTTEGAGKVTHVDVAQPYLSSITVAPTSNSATINWMSSAPATARVMYSTSYPFNYNTAPSVMSTTGLSTGQSVTLSNLQGNTTYYYVVESLDAQGNFSWSANGPSFHTN